MPQIQAGVTYATGAQVTATNLNAHVNNAVLVPGAISDQAAAASATSSDSVLLLQGGALKKATLAQLQAGVAPDTANYIQRNGSVAMTGELTLSSSTPVNALSAASKGYVDTKQAALGYTPVNKAGDTMLGTLTLAADPVSALQAATKQYADTKQSALGFVPVNKAGDTMTGALTLSADPASALQASTKQYVDTQIASVGGASVPAGAIMAFYRSTPPTGWLECNGQSAAAYPNLVALGIINTPDLRGEFVRGWDNGKGTDPGRSLGSAQAQDIQPHTHSYTTYGRLVAASESPGGTFANTTTSNTGSTGGTETRPRNIALMYCIKT